MAPVPITVMMRNLIAALLSVLVATGATAQERAPGDSLNVRVGLVASPPLVIRLPGGRFRGIAYELWRETAATAGLSHVERVYETEAAMLDALADGAIDIAIGDIDVSYDRERKVDFLFPYLHSNNVIATTDRTGAGLFVVLGKLASRVSLEIVLAAIGALLAVTAAIWCLERRRNEDLFGERGRDFVSGLLYTATIATALEGDILKMRSRAARTLGLVLLLLGTTLVASWIAMVSSALTVHSLAPKISSAAQLRGARIGVEMGSEGAIYLDRRGLQYTEYESTVDAVRDLAGGHLDAIVCDRAIMNWLIGRDRHEGVVLLPETLEGANKAFAVRQGSALRERLNSAQLRVTESETWTEILSHYGFNR